MWVRARKVDLVVVLDHQIFINEFELRDDCSPIKGTASVQVWNISDDKAVAVERDGKAAFNQPCEVRITIDQFLKH